MSEIVVGADPVSVEDVEAVSLGGAVRLDAKRFVELDASAASLTGPDAGVIDAVSDWLTGGHGDAGVEAFLAAHDTAVGERLTAPEARATLFARAVVLAQGGSGVRGSSVAAVLAALSEPPSARREGSLGAAGCPVLAGLFRELVLQRRVPSPTEKEALSWINGPSYAVGLGALAVARAQRVLHAADAALALTAEAVRADTGAFVSEIADARRHRGVAVVAAQLRTRLAGSSLAGPDRAPDAFSVRCAPTVHGAVHDAMAWIRAVVEAELSAVSDNPLWIDGKLLRGGNVHGAPVAAPLDLLKIVLTQLATICERRVYRLTHGGLSGLQSFLVANSGLQSGLMLAQYTAASLTSEAKGLCFPSAVDSIPTAQHLEDHVPFAARAARGAIDVVDLVADVVAIELLCAAQAVDLRGGGLAPGTQPTFDAIRQLVPMWTRDRVLYEAIAPIGLAVRAGSIP